MGSVKPWENLFWLKPGFLQGLVTLSAFPSIPGHLDSTYPIQPSSKPWIGTDRQPLWLTAELWFPQQGTGMISIAVANKPNSAFWAPSGICLGEPMIL